MAGKGNALRGLLWLTLGVIIMGLIIGTILLAGVMLIMWLGREGVL